MPIGGSPGVFFVEPAAPVAGRSKLLPPSSPPVTHQSCELTLISMDKLGALHSPACHGILLDCNMFSVLLTPLPPLLQVTRLTTAVPESRRA